MAKKDKTTKKNESEHFTYCSIKKCPHKECLRHDCNAPFNVLIYQKKYSPNKDWDCEDYLNG